MLLGNQSTYDPTAPLLHLRGSFLLLAKGSQPSTLSQFVTDIRIGEVHEFPGIIKVTTCHDPVYLTFRNRLAVRIRKGRQIVCIRRGKGCPTGIVHACLQPKPMGGSLLSVPFVPVPAMKQKAFGILINQSDEIAYLPCIIIHHWP